MLALLTLLVILGAADRVECSCREISIEDTTDDLRVCVFNGTVLSIGDVVRNLHPECMGYKCVDEDLVNMCGLGYNDENQYSPDDTDQNCKETKNFNCSVTMTCRGKPPVLMADGDTSLDIPLFG